MSNRHKVLLLIISWLVLFVFPLYAVAQPITFAELAESKNHSSWQLAFTSPGIVNYHAYLLTKPMMRLLIEFTPASELDYRINPFLLASTPLTNMRSGLVGAEKLRILFDLRRPMQMSTQTINAVPNRLVITLTETKPATTASAAPATQVAKPRPVNTSQPTVTAKLPAAYSVPASVAVNKEKSNKALRRIIVVIDPGHGGKDPGATGIHGIHEKDVVLNISKKLQMLINRQPGFYAVLTRSGDYFIPLRQRLTIARQDKADMFVAIHADAYLNPYSHGASVYALSSRGATSEAARWLAQRENQSELMGGVDLADKENVLRSVLLNLSQTATIHASLLIGNNLLQGLCQFAHLHYAHVEQAAFVVLKSPDIPSLLVETGFVSNAADAQNLNNSAYQQKIAQALMAGITHYFQLNPPPDTWLAEQCYPTTDHYVVQHGDNLSGIAAKLGVSMIVLRTQNHLSGDTIHVGQSLQIPG